MSVCKAFKSCLLKMANLIGGVDKMCSFPKESVDTSCYHNSLNLTLLDRWTRVDAITRTFGDREWFSSKGRLISRKRSYEEKDHYGSSKAKWFKKVMTMQRTWSIFKGSPSRRRASAGIMSPSLILTMSPGTRMAASSSVHRPSRRTWWKISRFRPL